MSRRVLLVVVACVAVLSAGCIPVTEPVGDIDKAEPDKALVGKWEVTRRGIAEFLEIRSLTVSAPDVEGNPKGLMRAVMNHTDNRETPLWFFTTTVGNHTYANLVVGPTDRQPPTFDEKGAFEKWKKETTKEYYVFRVARDGDKLTLDCGNNGEFVAQMKAENISDNGRKFLPVFQPPAGWLAKYLDKNRSDRIFDGTNVVVLAREKK